MNKTLALTTLLFLGAAADAEAAKLRISVQDELDLATHSSAFEATVDTDREDTFDYIVTDWWQNEKGRYSFRLQGSIKKVDENTYYLSVRKTLLRDGTELKTLLLFRTLMEPGHKESRSDYYWDEGTLALRQLNTFAME